MTGTEYLFGLILLILGFNLGFNEANKGLTFEDLKKMVQTLRRKLQQ